MRDEINDVYEELMVESVEGDRLADKLLKQFDKIIAAEVKKAKVEGLDQGRLTQWVQWKIANAWGR